MQFGQVQGGAMKKLLIQQGCMGQERLLEITRARHDAYCARYGYERWTRLGMQDYIRHPFWEKIRLIIQALRTGYEEIVWLDADCLIARDEDLTGALQPISTMPIGMVRYDVPYAVPAHFNAGAIYLRAGTAEQRKDLIRLMEDVWADWPSIHPWEEQNGLNRALAARTHIACQCLDYRWNCIPAVACADPVVRAWHGETPEARIEAMGRAVLGMLTEG